MHARASLSLSAAGMVPRERGEKTGAVCREVHLAGHPLAAEGREGFWPGDTLGAKSIFTWSQLADEWQALQAASYTCC